MTRDPKWQNICQRCGGRRHHLWRYGQHLRCRECLRRKGIRVPEPCKQGKFHYIAGKRIRPRLNNKEENNVH